MDELHVYCPAHEGIGHYHVKNVCIVVPAVHLTIMSATARKMQVPGYEHWEERSCMAMGRNPHAHVAEGAEED
jgi:hypothetical protein